ncbi:24185_t:CDS:2, partial [Dentiscutata erythropus]
NQEPWDDQRSEWVREGEKDVAIKIFKNAIKLSSEFLVELENSLKFLKLSYMTRIYGLTCNPQTGEYAIVLQFQRFGNLRQYLLKHLESLEWFDLIRIFRDISEGSDPENRPKAEFLHETLSKWTYSLSMDTESIEKREKKWKKRLAEKLPILLQRNLISQNQIINSENLNIPEKDLSGLKEIWFEGQVENLEIPYEELKISPVPLGGGRCGELRRATWIKFEKIKELKKHFIHEEQHLLVIEYANCGNLENFLENQFVFKRLSWLDKLQLALGIAEGLKCLHNADIIHRDLHPGNILLHDPNPDPKILTVPIPKISDFGAGKRIGLTTSHRNGVMGAIRYREPQRHDEKDTPLQKWSDIFSLGVIMWQISSGRAPFEDEIHKEELSKKIKDGARETKIEGTPDRYGYLFEDCWKFEPKSRPNINQVVDILMEIKIKESENKFKKSQGIFSTT